MTYPHHAVVVPFTIILSMATIANARSHCLNQLKRFDYPSYLQHSFQPTQLAKDSFLTIRAFNVDLALVPDQVSNTTVGKMRYQFWTETVDSAFKGHPQKQPVAVLLDHILSSGVQLTKPYLLRMIAERERTIDNPSYYALSNLESYAEKTYSTLLYLQLESLDLRKPALDDIAQHIGLATGITNILRGFPYFIGKGSVSLPVEICTKHGLKQDDLLKRRDVDGLNDAVFEVATRANDHLISAKVMLKELQENKKSAKDAELARPVFLSAVPTQMFLARLEKFNFDPTEPKLMKREFLLPYRLWRGF